MMTLQVVRSEDD